ncbi:FunK1 protein kinase [Xylaria curta]|nr:FunK1 protein kinase [Xylaria curta]
MENHAPASETEDQEILNNIDGRMHGPMSGFLEKYFGGFHCIHQDGFLEIKIAGRGSSRCTIPVAAPSSDNFLQWFSNYVSQELDGVRGSWHTSSYKLALNHKSDDEGARILLTIPGSLAFNPQIRWHDVRIVGEFYRCPGVFASQPTRLFLHGFYIRGELIELWVFDRSGLYCSDIFDIRKDSLQFLSVILSYSQMTNQELGITSIIKMDEGRSYVTLDGAAMPSLGKLYLETRPIASHKSFVGNGTVFYRAKTPNSDQWNHLAKERCVWEAISLVYYTEVESTANLRRGLRWGTHRKFTNVHLPERSRDLEEQQEDDAYNAGGLTEHTEKTGDFFRNRILACVVTSPVGRPLHTFHSVSELLRVFRDAIKCHQSLYYDANILHQDISPGNIIILDDQDGGKPRGMLIDLDSAVELDQPLETEINITGTRPFMAIGVLRSERHTYRHDLESFLYAFLWTIITSHAESPPETSKLQKWSNGDWDELATRKSLDMDQDSFWGILREFPHELQSLKPLAKILRQILFPLRDKAIWTGTDGSVDGREKLYSETRRLLLLKENGLNHL